MQSIGKKLVLIVIIFLFVFNIRTIFLNAGKFSPNATVDIWDAEFWGYIDVEIFGKHDGSNVDFRDGYGKFFGPSLTVKLKSNLDQYLGIKTSPGRLLNPNNYEYQKMIITKSEIFDLNVRGTEEFELFAMCLEYDKKIPKTDIQYSLGRKAPEDTIAVTQIIDFSDNQNYYGDLALFLVSGDLTESEARDKGFTDYDIEKANKLIDAAIPGSSNFETSTTKTTSRIVSSNPETSDSSVNVSYNGLLLAFMLLVTINKVRTKKRRFS
jgi:hypothetical protein